jgi:hypothetical protein
MKRFLEVPPDLITPVLKSSSFGNESHGSTRLEIMREGNWNFRSMVQTAREKEIKVITH